MTSGTSRQLDPAAHVAGDSRYVVNGATVLLSGTQALIRLALMQSRRDMAAGLNTGGFISGYRGSPLGGLDQAILRAGGLIEAHDIRFQPGLNEEIAATAMLGTQQVNLLNKGKRDGVFGLWYAKGPGVDRSGDALRHGNLAGSAPHGGVLLLAGDDHVCKSSTTSHQSEFALVDAMIPVLNPSNIADILEFGIHAWALSRYSGCWSSLKLSADVVDTSASIEVDDARVKLVMPTDFEMPEGGLGIRWPDTPQQQERRLHTSKMAAVHAFARANGIDRSPFGATRARVGIVTTGKSYEDVRQAFAALRIDERTADLIGIAVYKVGLVWPLEPAQALQFCEGLDVVLVIEEKRGLIEGQLKELLYGRPADRRPPVLGKCDESGRPLFPSHDDLNPRMIARAIVERIVPLIGDPSLVQSILAAPILSVETDASPSELRRGAYFCSGCPHSTSTRVPEGSQAMAGIGCHWMAQSMDRSTATSTHMGSEGTNWIGQAPFSSLTHVFQNMGDGTYFHSGLLAIRAAIAAKVNITYKILFNDAVAMTGGQSHDGTLTPQAIASQLRAEGVARIAVVTDDIDKYSDQPGFDPIVTIHPRAALDTVQRELREVAGVSALIYDQVCAAEKRRRGKRSPLPGQNRRVLINPLVCEGCGDCSVKSNCLSVVPIDTIFGTKRTIDQSSCNTDLSCLNGFCPSFVTVSGGSFGGPQSRSAIIDQLLEREVPDAALPSVERPFNVLITGIGGTGVVTIGAILSAAARIAGFASLTLDMAGMAQKGGAVSTHLQIAEATEALHSSRVVAGSLDALIGCDMVVTSEVDVLATAARGRTLAVVNLDEAITGAFTRDPKARVPVDALIERIDGALGKNAAYKVSATKIAKELLGDAIATNFLMVGFAYQTGLLPLHADAIMLAIERNGVAVELNKQAFRLGRLTAHDGASVAAVMPGANGRSMPTTFDEIVSHRAEFLRAYQNAGYADSYRRFATDVRDRSIAIDPNGALCRAVAISLAQLMAYKDEYEVARLHGDKSFRQAVGATGGRVEYHLAPPMFARPDPATGHPVKVRFGSWVGTLFPLVAAARFLRGTPLDVFGYSIERRNERALIDEYRAVIERLLSRLKLSNLDAAVRIAEAAQDIRGYGHVKERNMALVRKEWTVLEGVFAAATDDRGGSAIRHVETGRVGDELGI